MLTIEENQPITEPVQNEIISDAGEVFQISTQSQIQNFDEMQNSESITEKLPVQNLEIAHSEQPEPSVITLESENLPNENESESVNQVEVSETTTEHETGIESINVPVFHATPDAVAASEDSAEGKETTVSEQSKEEAEADAKQKKQKHIEEVFNHLKIIEEKDEPLEVSVKGRIRGGLRVSYDGFPMFLPASHCYLKRNPTENELTELLNKKIKVFIHELHEDETGRKTAVVSRHGILEEELWNSIKVGDIVEGRVSSVASFGVFLDIGGIEGLIHISRLSQFRISDLRTMFKKGQTLKAVIVEIDKDNSKISLSRKELEASPWEDVETLFPIDSEHRGIVRRLTDFGAYIELKLGVDGLLRNSEISWTRRVKKLRDFIKIGDEIPVKVLTVSREKEVITLSHKQTQHNPWSELKEKYPPGSEYLGTILQIIPQGAIVGIDGIVDGFMPRSKMKSIIKGRKIPYKMGETLPVLIEELVPEQESLILAPKIDEQMSQVEQIKDDKKFNSARKDRPPQGSTGSDSGSFNFGDLLSDSEKNSLNSLS